MKKCFFVTALLCMVAALVFSGGKGQQTRKSQMDGRVKGSLPLSDGSVTFSVFIGQLDNYVTSYDYAENVFTKKLVDETGIKLNIIGASTADASQKRNVLLSSGDYPDIFLGGTPPRDFMTYYAQQGVFISLNDYHFMEYPRIKTLIDEYPELLEQMAGADGKIYGFPQVNDCAHCQDDRARSFLYMPWIRNNKRKVPANLTEFVDYLRFVRDNDLNGNGNKNDEVPFTFQSGQFRNAVSLFAKMYMPFVFTTDYFGLALENKKVIDQYKDPRFREALKTMASLYKEKLIQPEAFTQNNEQLISLVESKDPTVAVLVNSHTSNFTYGTGDRRIDFNLMPVMAGPAGLKVGSNRDPWGIFRMGMFVTDKCKDPELAVALYDYMLRPDINLSVYIGPKGVAWDDPDPNTQSLSGGNPLYKLLITWRSPDMKVNTSWAGSTNGFGYTREFRLGEQARDFDIVNQWIATGDPALRSGILSNASYFEMHNFLSLEGRTDYWLPKEAFIPPITMNANDTARAADINTPLFTYIDQSMAQFVTGARDINSDFAWNTYLSELDRLGSKELIAIYQKYIK
jgi:putative aldouronate transport system substrate-binding protein